MIAILHNMGSMIYAVNSIAVKGTGPQDVGRGSKYHDYCSVCCTSVKVPVDLPVPGTVPDSLLRFA